ncbi:protocadherin Fat 4-like [Patella vulgata]|uniref:protocadherin Fat 4-like n=1 Tax=Patella vulgata TaxID=6465 RepID=UPI0024A81A2E|nr:protocadherin Fat 4-like [Patella vulgata]
MSKLCNSSLIFQTERIIFFQPGITYTIVGNSDSPDYFKIDSTSGVISIKKDLRTDPSDRSQYIVRVKASKQFAVNLQEVFSTVTINVQRNVNPPIFGPDAYDVTIDEKSPLGMSVVQLNATDADQDVLRYSSTAIPDYFYLGPTSGLISVRRPLTGANSIYTFAVTVSDQFNPAKTDVAQVSITITQDTSPPLFVNLPYSRNIPFTQAQGSSIYQVEATDNDIQGSIVYGLSGDYLAAPAYFAVQSITGVISVRNPLTTDSATSYTLGVIAYDSGSPDRRASANVTITIDRNPQAPVISPLQYAEIINENQAVLVPIITVQGSDPDGQAVRYSFTNASPTICNDYFTIYAETGQIVAKQYLTESPQTLTSCVMSITATDVAPSPKNSQQATARITIQRNTASPVFLDIYETTVPENAPLTREILNVTAVDADSTAIFSTVTYELIGDDDVASFFSLNPNNGIITINSDLTRADKNQYTARIVAKDGGNPARSAVTTAKINILRNLNSPVFDSLTYSNRILETRAIDTQPVITCRASDADSPGPQSVLSYQMVDTTVGNKASIYFRVDQANCNVYMRQSLIGDADDTLTYTFNIIASDNGIPRRSTLTPAAVTITVDRNLFAPIFVNAPYESLVNVNQALNVVVDRVNATDADRVDPFNRVRYSIIGNSPYFAIDSVSGDIRKLAALTTDNDDKYSVIVRAFDGGTPSLSSETTVTVNVNRNLNDPSLQTGNRSITIFETQTLGEVLFTVDALDSDLLEPYNVMNFAFSNPTGPLQEFFNVDSKTGDVYAKKSLRLTGINNFEGSVRVCDEGQPPYGPRCASTLAYFTIIVIRNNNTPFFEQLPYQQNLGTTLTPNTFVLQAFGRDNDPDTTPFGQLEYSIIGDDVAPSSFNIDPTSGRISVSNTPAATSADGFFIRIQVCDKGVPPKCNTTVARVTVRTNFAAPIFAPTTYSQTVIETFPLGDKIVDVNATDTDSVGLNGRIQYSIAQGTEGMACFDINVDTGVIFAKKALNQAPCNRDSYVMSISATDMGTPAQTSNPLADVTINIIKNLAPNFQNDPYTPTILETDTAGKEVYILSAIDPNNVTPYNQLQYEIVGDGTATTYFSIVKRDNNNAALILQTPVDADTLNTYRVTVVVSDGGNPSLSDRTTVTVSPEFNTLTYTVVGEQTATVLFTVNSNNGQVSVVQTAGDQYGRLFSETGILYNLIVKVNDGRCPDVFAQLRINVNRNLQPPVWTTADFIVTVLETASVSQSITAVSANDNDPAVNLLARDNGIPSRVSGPARLTVTVLRNQFPPIFQDLPYVSTISLNNIPATVATVRATDADTQNPFNVLSYRLIGDGVAVALFEVDTNGQIKVRAGLESDSRNSYTARVEVRDGGTPALYDVTEVVITVSRNFAPPVFSHRDINVEIPYTSPIGTFITNVNASDADTTLVLEARDGGSPSRFATVNVRVSILRDSGLLAFTAPNYATTISENVPVGQEVQVVLAQPGLQVKASVNAGVTEQTAIATVTINVTRNEFSPVWNRTNYEETIEERLAPGTQILAIGASDQDGDVIDYRIVSGTPNTDYFYLHPTTGKITLVKVLTDTTANRFDDVLIYEITDVNNRAARYYDIDQLTGVIRIRESLVGTSHARDTEKLVFEMTGDFPSQSFFRINRDTGEVTLINPIRDDGLKNGEYKFNILAEDGGSPTPNQCRTVVRVNVIVDQPPVFQRIPYSVTIDENIANTNLVFDTEAIDPDLKGQLVYNLVGSLSAPYYFQIDSSSGIITVQRSLRSDSFTQYEAVVTAYDDQSLGKTATATVTISMVVRVSDQRTPAKTAQANVRVNVLRDNNPPRFTFGATPITISENLPVGNNFKTVTAVDNDLRGSIVYETVGDGSAPYFFNVDSSTGAITIKNSLLTDPTTFQYTLQIKAYDSAYPGNSVTAPVVITVLRNENPPVFVGTPYSDNINEKLPVGTSFFNIRATDADGDRISYYATGDADAMNFFNVNSDTGAISVSKPLEGQTAGTYRLSVNATDNAVRERWATSFVTITGKIVIEVEGDYPAPTFFQLGTITNGQGDITLMKDLMTDFTRLEQYVMRLKAYDDARPDLTATATAFINVIRNANGPRWVVPSYDVTIPEDHPVLGSVVNVTAVDADPTDTIKYDILSETIQRDLSTGPANYFFIDVDTGVIVLRQSVLNTNINEFLIT